MQEEGGSKKVNPVLEQHWEKIVLGVVAALALFFIGSKFSGGGNAAVKKVETALSETKRRIEGRNDKTENPKPVSEKVPGAIAPANRPPEYTVGKKTHYKPNFVYEKEVPTNFRFPDISMGAPTVTPTGVVTLTWSVAKLEAEANPPRGLVIPKPTTYFYKIDKREKGAEWGVLVQKLQSDKDRVQYQDEDTKAKTDYEYRVTLGSNDNQYTNKVKNGLTDKISSIAAARTLGIWSVEFNNIQTFDDDTGEKVKPGQAYVIIRKYEKEHGLVEWRKIQHEGEELGVITENGVSDSKHRVTTQAGKAVVVDFRMGGKIKKITTGKTILYNYQECNRKLDKNGEWTCEGPKKVPASYKVHEVLYTDEDGKDQAFTMPDGPGPIGDKLCPEHGGAPPPKELTPAERLAQREEEANKLMDKADTLWDTDEKPKQRQAQDLYKKLLSSFIDLEAVKARKGEFTERSKKNLN